MEPRLTTIYLYLMYELLLKVILCSVWQFLYKTKVPDTELPTWGILLVFRSFLFCISVLIVTSSHQESHINCVATYTRTSFASFCLSSQSPFSQQPLLRSAHGAHPTNPLHLALRMNKGTAVLGTQLLSFIWGRGQEEAKIPFKKDMSPRPFGLSPFPHMKTCLDKPPQHGDFHTPAFVLL